METFSYSDSYFSYIFLSPLRKVISELFCQRSRVTVGDISRGGGGGTRDGWKDTSNNVAPGEYIGIIIRAL